MVIIMMSTMRNIMMTTMVMITGIIMTTAPTMTVVPAITAVIIPVIIKRESKAPLHVSGAFVCMQGEKPFVSVRGTEGEKF